MPPLFFTVKNVEKLLHYRFFHTYYEDKNTFGATCLKNKTHFERNEKQMNQPITIFLREVHSGQALRVDLPTCETDFCTRLWCGGTAFQTENIHFDGIPRAGKLLMHEPKFNELNYLAILYGALTDTEKQLFTAVIESGCAELVDTKDLINLTQSLDNFYMLQGVSTPSMLCAFYLSAAAHYDPKPILKKIRQEDYPKIGEILVNRQHGGFYDGSYYVLRSGSELKNFYSGQERDIPIPARIFL